MSMHANKLNYLIATQGFEMRTKTANMLFSSTACTKIQCKSGLNGEMRTENKYNSFQYCLLFIYYHFLTKSTNTFQCSHHECLLTDFFFSFSLQHTFIYAFYTLQIHCTQYITMYVKISRLHKFTNILFDEHTRSMDDSELHKNQIHFV